MPDKDFESFETDDVLNAWVEAFLKGLGQGRTPDPAIVDIHGETLRLLRARVSQELEVRCFNAAAYRASRRVAMALGAICAVMADATPDRHVSVDVFQRARELTRLHPACPAPTAVGTGPFC